MNCQVIIMDMNLYFKKIYTVAFRLTGDKKEACELASQAILKLADKTDTNNEISDGIFKSAALEVCSLFLERFDAYTDEFNYCAYSGSKDEVNEIQEAILSLDPVCRITIVWKDLLSFQLSDLTFISNKDKKELNARLSQARMRIKENCVMDMLF